MQSSNHFHYQRQSITNENINNNASLDDFLIKENEIDHLPLISIGAKKRKLPIIRQRVKESSRLLPQYAIDIMTSWYDLHYSNPYPTFRECEQLAQTGGITTNQVKQWFVNVRRRTHNQFRKRRETKQQKHQQSIDIDEITSSVVINTQFTTNENDNNYSCYSPPRSPIYDDSVALSLYKNVKTISDLDESLNTSFKTNTSLRSDQYYSTDNLYYNYNTTETPCSSGYNTNISSYSTPLYNNQQTPTLLSDSSVGSQVSPSPLPSYQKYSSYDTYYDSYNAASLAATSLSSSSSFNSSYLC
jgi:hypothetical protein